MEAEEGSMAGFEAKQEAILQKQLEQEQERKRKIKEKEAEVERRQREPDAKKAAYEREIEEGRVKA